jgi:hypothetical protein
MTLTSMMTALALQSRPSRQNCGIVVNGLTCIGKSVKVLDKVGARTTALKALEKLGAVKMNHNDVREEIKFEN